MEILGELDTSLACQVQQLLLPKTSPVNDWSSIGVKNVMAHGLGGDFFEFLPTPDGCQSVMIGDVTGHGISASVVMSLCYGYIHSVVESICSSSAVMARVNNFLKNFAIRSQTYDHLFSTTLFFGIIDPVTLEMHYINAGHPAPLIHRGSYIINLEATAPPLGFLDDVEYSVTTFQFRKGDRWLLYTDGITETTNADGILFGVERLNKLLSYHKEDHLDFLEIIFNAVKEFNGKNSPKDDCTAIAIDFHQADLTNPVRELSQ